ncbi:FecR domain-containing protein [Achromobacter sp. GG226]|uniref:FecR family protein n=1 Tax=Verticiella alkaliphila TaxID=2779529 RepID=UPI001C0D8E2E|nr:FecR domain-containing protein [Verticiella sp. GG226]MBU4612972.1 FecR domain-containing protein [Verticiella sp. GG226]
MTPLSDDDSPPGASRIEDEALAWLVRRSDRPDAETERTFAAWVGASPRHREAYERWALEWQALDAVPARAREALGEPAAIDSRLPTCPRRRVWLGVGLAAGAATWLAVSPDRQGQAVSPITTARYATAAGELRPLVLPDGSQVELDTASTLSVAWDESHRRLTLPMGQAWFDVREDAARPFDIFAGPARVRVVGTQLTVRHLTGSQAGAVEVAVLRGQVQVGSGEVESGWRRWWHALAGNEVTVLAGQRLRLSAQGRAGAVTAVDPARLALWRDRRLALDDVTLADALAEFARYGHTVPRLADARAASLRLTGIFDARQPERFYQALPQVLPVQVREDAQGRVIASAV